MGLCGGGGGGTSTQYVQSPEERKLMRRLMPVFDYIFPRDAGGQPRSELYDIPALNIETPTATPVSASDYIPGGDQFESVYGKIAPSFWSSYEQDVENPLIGRFAKSGTLGSPVAGVGGSAMAALTQGREKASQDINKLAYESAQQPLLQALQGAQQMGLADFSARSNAATQEAVQPWQALLQERQYPYQILPGILGGVMPQPVVTQQSGGGMCG